MTNSTNQLSAANRAMIAGAMLGGGASAIYQLSAYKKGQAELDDAVKHVLGDAARTAIASGLVTAVAESMAGRPVLSMLTLFTTGAAGIYLLDEISGGRNDGEEADQG